MLCNSYSARAPAGDLPPPCAVASCRRPAQRASWPAAGSTRPTAFHRSTMNHPLHRTASCPRRSRSSTQVVAGKPAAAAAAATVAAAPEAAAWVTATGVPLLEVLQQLTLQQAAVRCAALVIATMVGVLLGNKLLAIMGVKMSAVSERCKSSSGVELLVGTALAAVHRPASVLLPFYGFFYTLLVATAFADVAVSRLTHIPSSLDFMHLSGVQIRDGLRVLTQLMQDASELMIIILAAWFAIRWKDQLVEALTASMEFSTAEEPELARALVPLSNLMSWAIVSAAVLTSLVSFGINIQPLLAVGSISTVAVGFAAQSTMQNVVSALQIYTSRPFIVGDRVQLKSLGGSVIATGVVEHIMPMRTVLRGDNKVPIYIGNKDILNLMIVNESKLRRMTVPSKLPLIDASLTVRYTDVDKLAVVEKSITEYLCSHPDIDLTISARCVLAEFTEAGPRLAIKALLQKSAGSRQSVVGSEILRAAERIARSHGAFLAINSDFGHELPPSPPAGYAASGGEADVTPAAA